MKIHRIVAGFIFLSLLSCDNQSEGKVEKWLFIGNSITQAGHYVDYIETWFLLNEENAPDMLDLGLSGETISGLSEPGRSFPRACLHDRIDSVLLRAQADLVIACYGMNCGIYHPFSEERFEAYKEGVLQLIEIVHESGAEIILLTPPPFASKVHELSMKPEDRTYGYHFPSPDYNEVLLTYAKWIMTLDSLEGVRALNIRPGLEKFMYESYPKEPVHPSVYGHKLMAEAFLQGIGKDTGSDILTTGKDIHDGDVKWNELLSLVKQKRENYDRSMLNDIGHKNPGIMKKPFPKFDRAVVIADSLDLKIDALLAAE